MIDTASLTHPRLHPTSHPLQAQASVCTAVTQLGLGALWKFGIIPGSFQGLTPTVPASPGPNTASLSCHTLCCPATNPVPSPALVSASPSGQSVDPSAQQRAQEREAKAADAALMAKLHSEAGAGSAGASSGTTNP